MGKFVLPTTELAATSNPFVILFQGRSGSSHLCSLLDQHPRVNCEQEIFSTVGRRGLGRRPFLASPGDCMTRLSQLYAKVPIHRFGASEPSASGFKIKPHQLKTYPEVKDFLLANTDNISVILLDRSNTWQIAVSEQIQSRLKELGFRANLLSGQDLPPDTFPLELDVKRLVFFSRLVERWRKELEVLAANFSRQLSVDYDQLVSHPESVLRSIHEFLGVGSSNVPLESRFSKVASAPYRELISNYDEAVDALLSTKAQGFLDEPLPNPAPAEAA